MQKAKNMNTTLKKKLKRREKKMHALCQCLLFRAVAVTAEQNQWLKFEQLHMEVSILQSEDVPTRKS